MSYMAGKVVSCFDKKTDLACSLKVKPQLWYQITLKLVKCRLLIWRYVTQRRSIKRERWHSFKMLHHIKSSLSFVSNQAYCRTKTAKVTKYFIETLGVISCGENLQNTQSKKIWRNAGRNDAPISIFVLSLFPTV